jgi:hypothetical protein
LLSELSQCHKDKYHTFSFICGKQEKIKLKTTKVTIMIVEGWLLGRRKGNEKREVKESKERVIQGVSMIKYITCIYGKIMIKPLTMYNLTYTNEKNHKNVISSKYVFF